MWILITFIPIYLTTIIDLGRDTAGLFEGMRRFIIVITIILSGSLVNNWGRKPLLIIGSFSFAAPLFYVLMPNIIGVWIGVIIFGITIGCFNPTSITYISDFAPDGKEGVYLGSLESISCFSRFLGPIIGGILADYLGLRLTYIVGSLMLFTTVILTLNLKEIYQK